MTYFVLGWGSLLWDLENLTPHVRPPWRMSAGPRLPMEFSRVSPKRKQALALVLDADHGAPCATHAIASHREDIAGVIGDLARRERAPLRGIGAICLRSGLAQSSSPQIASSVRDWCRAEGADGAVWTDLERNFEGDTGRAFTLDRAVAYLRALPGESLREAVRYIENAPTATDTPLRRRLSQDPWWLSLLEAGY